MKCLDNLEQERIIHLSKEEFYIDDNIIRDYRAFNSSKGDKDMYQWFKEQSFYNQASYEKIINYIELMKNYK